MGVYKIPELSLAPGGKLILIENSNRNDCILSQLGAYVAISEGTPHLNL